MVRCNWPKQTHQALSRFKQRCLIEETRFEKLKLLNIAKERERQRQTETETETGTERQRETERETERNLPLILLSVKMILCQGIWIKSTHQYLMDINKCRLQITLGKLLMETSYGQKSIYIFAMNASISANYSLRKLY